MSSLVPGGQTVSDVIPGLPATPPVDYSSRDYQSILNDLIALIPTYIPQWTDRAPGDFGIVLLELFSYTADILNYYIDRVANEAFLATAQQRQSVLNIANLLDYTPHNAVSATTQLQFTIAQPSGPVVVPAGTQVSTAIGGGVLPAVVFETTQDLTIWGDGVTTTADFVSNGAANQRYVLTGPYDGMHETVTVTPPVGGAMPVPWQRATANSFGGADTHSQVYILSGADIIQFGDGVHGAIPPAGSDIHIEYSPAAPNTYQGLVDAQHGVWTRGESVGYSMGLPNQRYTLFKSPVVDGTLSVYVNQGQGPVLWQYFQRMVDAFNTDLAYTTNTDANGIVSVIFGDGVTGVIPLPGAVITADYLVGGGVVGNVAANTLTVLSSTALGVIAVTNPQVASGGADAETMSHIRTHAPLSITAINRAVTLDDYAALVLNIPSVAKASATSTDYNAVHLYIHPAGDFFGDSATLTARVNFLIPSITNSNMTGYLDDKKMATVSIQVMPPKYNRQGVLQTGYVPVDVTVQVNVLPQYHQSVIQQNVSTAIYNLLLFSVVDFGYRVTVSSVYHAVQGVEGVDYCQVMVMCRDEVVPQTLGDIVCAPYEIPQANQITVGVTGGIIF